jgi:hypothetical protein
MPSEASNNLKSSTTEELRLRNYRASLQQKSDIENRELQARNVEEVQHLMDTHTVQMDELKRAYDVQISQEAEGLEEKLQKVRISGEDRVNLEKQVQEAELAKVKTSSQLKIEEYKKNSEVQIDKLRKDTQATTDLLHDKAKKATRKEREGTPA